MKPPIFVFLLPWLVYCALGQANVPTSGQCQAICLKEFAKTKEFLTLRGKSYQEIDVTNNTDFSLCKLGCHSPNFSDLVLPAFKKGQIAYQHVLDRRTNAPLTVSPVHSVTLVCADMRPNATVSGRVLLEVKDQPDTILVHYVEAVRRPMDGTDEEVIWTTWSYSPFLEFRASLAGNNKSMKIKDQSIQFKVTSFNGEGIMGKAVTSEWILVEQLITATHTGIDMEVKNEMWHDDTASVELSLKNREGSLTVCSLTLSYLTHTGHPQSIAFVMDRSRGFLLERLAFDYTYSIQLEPTVQQTVISTPSLIKLHVPPCIRMVNDPSMCAPPAVSDIEWKWNISQTEGQTIVLSWEYDSSSYDAAHLKGAAAAHARMVHFDVSVEALPTTNQLHCESLDSQRRVVTWTHRSVILYIPDDRCNYEVGITVVDSRNRRSQPKTSRIVRYEEHQSMLAMNARWNVEMFLLVSFVFAILIIAGGMAVCRARDRNEFNTLKRQHRQLTKSIVVAQSASTLPRSQCLTVVDGRGRPISSGESDISGETQKNICSPPPTRTVYYGDEGVYDSLDTPTRSEISFFDRMSACSFHRANPIYAGFDLRGQMLIPFDRLHATQISPVATKPWISANALDKQDATGYCMKYAIEDCSSLRHELSIVSRISTDHPNLVYFFGLAVRESQVISLLFEPVRGGTLTSFLNDVRTSFIDRDEFTPSPSSSGYDGSSKSDDSLDRHQQRIDRLVTHLYGFARQIANGMCFLHAQRVSHGRVCGENVFLLKTFKDALHLPCDQEVKLGDYDHATYPDGTSAPLAAPVHLLPPEVLQGKPHSTTGDIWQFGLLLGEIVSLGSTQSLWDSCEGIICDKAVKNYYSRLTAGQETSKNIDPGLVQLKQKIGKCLHLEPKKRINARDLEKELFDIQPQSLYREHMESVEV